MLTSAYHFAVNSRRLHSVVLTLAQRTKLMKDVYDVERSANEESEGDVENENYRFSNAMQFGIIITSRNYQYGT